MSSYFLGRVVLHMNNLSPRNSIDGQERASTQPRAFQDFLEADAQEKSLHADHTYNFRGTMTNDRKSKTPKFNLRNWECGVIFPVTERSEARATKADGEGFPGWDVFMGQIPIPMLVPKNDGSSELGYGDRKPWFFA